MSRAVTISKGLHALLLVLPSPGYCQDGMSKFMLHTPCSSVKAPAVARDGGAACWLSSVFLEWWEEAKQHGSRPERHVHLQRTVWRLH